MRFFGLDVDRDFCEVAIAEGGQARLAGRVQTELQALALVAQSLSVDDEVALEATGNALGIARMIAPQVGRVVLANPKAVKGITQAGAKTDTIDARTLAKLLGGGFLPAEMRRLLSLPGVNVVTAAASDRRDRRHQPRPDRTAAGQRPRPRPAGAPVRHRAGPAGADLQAGAR